MSYHRYAQLRRALADRGLVPASAVPDASHGSSEDAAIRPARLLEGAHLTTNPVGAAEAWPGTVAFLDGVQHSELIGYAGAAPIVVAEVAAAVRERIDRRLVTVIEQRERIAVGRAEALDAAGDLLDDFARVELSATSPAHPSRDLAEASRKIDQRRGNLELRVGGQYRRRSAAWLVVDGSLAASPSWAADDRMVGIVKSHATLPVDGADLERYLRLPSGHRTGLFAPAGTLAPVHAWALRLWPWHGKDVFHGLIRVEVAPAVGVPATADAISRWLLAERTPLSTPDPRWDRLLYGIRSVEQYLRARSRGAGR